MENLAGGKIELDDQVVCCKAQRTEITAGQLIIVGEIIKLYLVQTGRI